MASPGSTLSDSFHSIKAASGEESLSKALISGQITEDDAQLIRMFVSRCSIVDDIKLKRQLKLTYTLVNWRRFIQPFRNLTIYDLYEAVKQIKNGTTKEGKPFAVHTIADHVAILKQFYRWLIEEEISTIPAAKLNSIKVPSRKGATTRTPDDLLSPEEIKALMASAETLRDRCLITMLYEGGFRIGEVGQMQWQNIRIDGTGVIININFKTGVDRYVRLVMSKEPLMKWRSEYPGKPEGENLIFVSRTGEQMTYNAMKKIITKTAQTAGIKKKFTLHIFRHSRITHLIQSGMNESAIKLMMWGSVSTNMFEVYAHLSGADIDREVLKLYGIDPGVQQVAKRVEPIVCPTCKEINSPISRYCHVCGEGLSSDAVSSDQMFQKFLFEKKDLLIEFLQSMESKK
jgi:site-specific recombinase XerD